jgi:Trypsin-like peptidase domain
MKCPVALAIFFGVIILGINLSCSSASYNAKSHSLNDGQYDSEFPYQNSSDELEKISHTIYRINCLSFYKAYIFSDESKIKLKDLNDSVINTRSIKKTYMDKSTSGTATLIYSSNGTVGLLTCAHVIDFPDTIISYYGEISGAPTDDIQSIAFKSKQFIYIAGFPEGSEVNEILADKEADIAILGNTYSLNKALRFQVFDYPFGKAKDLEWGDFVYVFGYPLNYKMISNAIVSSPDYDKSGSFFVDAVVNRGSSGGLVLAIRDGIPHFELVGIIEWVAEENENILQPAPLEGALKYNPLVPYKGDAFVKQEKFMKYGITKVISIESIENFLMKNKDYFIKKGYDFSIYNK